MSKILCSLGFHSWKYFSRIHYKYWGPVDEYFVCCKRCKKQKEIFPDGRKKYLIDGYCTKLKSKSSC